MASLNVTVPSNYVAYAASVGLAPAGFTFLSPFNTHEDVYTYS